VIAAVEFVIRLFVPPAPVIVTVYVFAAVEVNEQVAVVKPPAVRVTEVGHVMMSPGGDDVDPSVTTPANWKEVVPRLVRVTSTPPLAPELKLTLVEFEAMLKPLVRIVSVP
jgi:hypothetical protein